MKFEHNKKYATIAMYVCLVILFAVVCVFFFLNYNDFGKYIKTIFNVFKPIIYGVVIAYVLNKIMKLFERKVFSFLDKKEGKKRLKRVLSVISSYVVFIAFLVAFVWMIVPQIAAGVVDLKNNIPYYIDAVRGWLQKLAEGEDFFAGYIDKFIAYLNDFLGNIYDLFQYVIDYIAPKITGVLSQIVTLLKDLVIGIVLSVYFLIQKEKFIAFFKRVFRAFLQDRKYNKFVSVIKQADNSFGGYIVAAAFDSLLVGIECFILFGIFGIPYYPLISFIVGVTNFIPFFGPFLGAIPSAFIIFIADPISVIWFVILILVIQQIDGNVIAPRIIGSHLGLSSVWVVIAITLMSGFFGFAGMVLGVPIFAILFTWVEDAVRSKLKNKGLPTELIDYYSDGIGKDIENERIVSETEKGSRPTMYEKIKHFIYGKVDRHKKDDEISEDGDPSENVTESDTSELYGEETPSDNDASDNAAVNAGKNE
ncbi:MAG: AI-2E family transporter [Eubacteriales bacterium]